MIALFEQYDKESRAMKEEALRMTWYMRGGIGYDEAMSLSFEERKSIGKIIKENMDITKKTKMPFF
jgi:hypothetical protein